MSDFEVLYKIGEGNKTRTFTVENAIDQMDASLKFRDFAPENSYIIKVFELKSKIKLPSHYKNRVHPKMIIENEFDQFIFDMLSEKSMTNQMLIDHLHINRHRWQVVRKHPEKLYFYDIMSIRDFFQIPLYKIVNVVIKVINQNKSKGILDFARGKAKH